MRKVLGKSFFARPTLAIAQDLIGKFLVRRVGKLETAAMITETEAYDGHNDKASHASRGETARNRPMFGESGRFYVYFVYGMHEMLNIVTGPKGYPAAVLIRGARLRLVRLCSPRAALPEQAEEIRGPGKLTKRLKIKRNLNGKMAIPESGLWFEDRGVKINKNDIKRTPRIGVSYAGPVWSKKRYRFVWRNISQ